MKIIAFAADADLWCPECAESRYPGCAEGDVLDREGNVVTPIFDTSSDVLLEICGGCGAELVPPAAELVEYVELLVRAGYRDDYTSSEILDKAYDLKRWVDSGLAQESRDLSTKWQAEVGN